MSDLPVAPGAAEAYANLTTIGGRPSLVLLHAKRLVKEQLPALIDHANAQAGKTAESGIKTPKLWEMAPALLGEKHRNAVLFGLSVRKELQGTQRLRNQITLRIFIVDGPLHSSEEVLTDWDRADLLCKVLQPYLSGLCVDGVRIWDKLKCCGVEMLPEIWADFSGVTLNYEVVQDPAQNYWP